MERSNRKVMGIELESPKEILQILPDCLAMGASLIFIYGVPAFICLIMVNLNHYWLYVSIYVCWLYYDRNSPRTGGYKWCPLRNGAPAAAKNYFNSKLIKTAEIPATNNYLLCAYPHGIIPFGFISQFVYSAEFEKCFPNFEVRPVSLSDFFWIPLKREFLMLHGCISSESNSIKHVLNSKEKNVIVALNVGGGADCKIAQPNSNRIALKNRKGFVRLALQCGVPMVPVYTFGENDLYGRWAIKWFPNIGSIIQIRTAIVLPINAIGRGIFQKSFGILPRRISLTTVVGEPIPVPKIENPTDEQITEYHNKFKTKLVDLFDAHKGKYDVNGLNAKLEIV